MKAKVLAIIHASVLSILIYWNYYINTGKINGKTVGDISDKLNNLFTPAGYAFAIWGIIYVGLIIVAAYMLFCAFKERNSRFIIESTPTLIATHLFNGIWLWCWINMKIGFSVLAMISILILLTLTSTRSNVKQSNTSKKLTTLVKVPIGLYMGWICVATIANISTYLKYINFESSISEILWTQITIILATLLGIFLVVIRKQIEVGGVIIWALIAIAIRHCDKIEVIVYTAIICAILIAITIVLKLLKKIKT